MSERLLNKEERLAIEATLPGEAVYGVVVQEWMKAQDARSTRLERLAIGARLEALYPPPRVAALDYVIAKLTKGEMP